MTEEVLTLVYPAKIKLVESLWLAGDSCLLFLVEAPQVGWNAKM